MYEHRKTIENTHISRERDRQRLAELLAVFSLGLPVGIFLLLFTWQNLEIIRLGREASRLQKTQQLLENDRKQLLIQLEQLTALDAVEEKAKALGFARFQPVQVVEVVPVTPSAQSSTGGQAVR